MPSPWGPCTPTADTAGLEGSVARSLPEGGALCLACPTPVSSGRSEKRVFCPLPSPLQNLLIRTSTGATWAVASGFSPPSYPPPGMHRQPLAGSADVLDAAHEYALGRGFFRWTLLPGGDPEPFPTPDHVVETGSACQPALLSPPRPPPLFPMDLKS